MAKKSANQKVASGPPSAGGAKGKTTKRPAIGVPGSQTIDAQGNVTGYEGYTATKEAGFGNRIGLSGPGTAPGPVYQAAPQYFQGDDYAPATMSPEAIARLQRLLDGAGLLKGKYRIGVWDDTSRGAYRNLLEYANSIGEDEQTALARYGEGAASEEEAKPKRAPLVIRQTSPDDLRVVADNVARRTIGRRLRPDELQGFVSAYQSQEAGAQRSAYNVTDPEGGGGTVVDVADPTAAAEARIRETAPAEAQGHDLADTYASFLKIIGAG